MIKGPKGKDLTTFVRFGNMDHQKKQKGFSDDEEELTFHAPPSSRGFYCFPKIAQEFFLIGSLPSTQPKSQFPKYKDGEVNDDYYKKKREVLRNMRKEFTKKKGEIWHHLDDYCKPNDILERHGGWVKTEMSVWRKAFNKSTLNERYGDGNFFKTTSISETPGINGYYSLDHYEMFVDEKV